MKKLILGLLAISFNVFADEYTENVYRKVFFGYDIENHPYLIISDDIKTLIYSTEKLYSRHNAVPSIILNNSDFQNLVREFKK